MQMQGVDPDLVTCTLLLDGLCKNGKLDEALGLYCELETSGIDLDIFVHSIMINGLCKADMVDEAFGLFSKLLDKGIEPNVQYNDYWILWKSVSEMPPLQGSIAILLSSLFTYAAIIIGICKSGDCALALNLLMKMEERNIEVNVKIYSTVIDGLCKGGYIDDALSLFEKMDSKEIAPNVVIYSCLINGLCVFDRWNDAV
ncbi:PREDICTED: pentatricopeptide repeat-containing protein At1g63330-like [Tarenaya hassleriana]|uniref:pentatricopeptide repeat-containing protein At1g63330-like n=1 Tax=Tarenaya hassleriana TaxID=28532 RepID=UPI0008FD6B71|nr:PREDICTED: pentatricopeptide repeat-containing protein At1g63330-like [Tarenaya hassleriana]